MDPGESTCEYYIFDDSPYVCKYPYEFIINPDGTVTMYRYSILPYCNRGCMTEAEVVAIGIANVELKIVGNDEPSSLTVQRGQKYLVPTRSDPPAPKAMAATAPAPKDPPPRTWFRVPGEH